MAYILYPNIVQNFVWEKVNKAKITEQSQTPLGDDYKND